MSVCNELFDASEKLKLALDQGCEAVPLIESAIENLIEARKLLCDLHKFCEISYKTYKKVKHFINKAICILNEVICNIVNHDFCDNYGDIRNAICLVNKSRRCLKCKAPGPEPEPEPESEPEPDSEPEE